MTTRGSRFGTQLFLNGSRSGNDVASNRGYPVNPGIRTTAHRAVDFSGEGEAQQQQREHDLANCSGKGETSNWAAIITVALESELPPYHWARGV